MRIFADCEFSRSQLHELPFYARSALTRARRSNFPAPLRRLSPRSVAPPSDGRSRDPHLRRFPPVTRSRRGVGVGECLAARLFSCALTATAVVRIGARNRVSRKRRLPASHLSSARSCRHRRAFSFLLSFSWYHNPSRSCHCSPRRQCIFVSISSYPRPVPSCVCSFSRNVFSLSRSSVLPAISSCHRLLPSSSFPRFRTCAVSIVDRLNRDRHHRREIATTLIHAATQCSR